MSLRKEVFIFIFAFIVFVKAIILAIIYHTGNDFFGGGNDSNYYDAYALGYDDVAVNIWPVMLRWLNDVGLYSREGVSFFLKFLGLLVIPFMVAKLSIVKISPIRHKIFWMVAVFVAIYPTLFYYTTDIYRDVFMIFMWLFGVFILKWKYESRRLYKKLFLFFLGFFIGFFLYELRPYLGFGYFSALFLSGFYSFRRYPFFISLIGLVFLLYMAFFIGLLEPVLKYRSIFHNGMEGGTNLGLSFESNSRFFVDLWSTVSYQLFGLFFVNLPSVFVFFIESLPFMIFLVYVVRNRIYSTKFVDCLIVFFITYSVIWLLGNDNLGTAVRLRMFNYISILIAFCVIYQRKKIHIVSLLNK